MKKSLSILTGITISLFLFVACGEEPTQEVEVDEVENVAEDTEEPEEEASSGADYDISVLTVECKEMLKRFEDLVTEIKSVEESIMHDPESEDLQIILEDLKTREMAMMKSDTMVECSHMIDYTHALKDIKDKYNHY